VACISIVDVSVVTYDVAVAAAVVTVSLLLLWFIVVVLTTFSGYNTMSH